MAQESVYNGAFCCGSYFSLELFLIHLESSSRVQVNQWSSGQHMDSNMYSVLHSCVGNFNLTLISVGGQGNIIW